VEALLFLATVIGVGVVMRWSYREDPLRKRRSPRPASATSATGGSRTR